MKDQVIDQTGWDYTIVNNDIIETDKLDIYEKMLYIALKRFANIQSQEAFPGVKKLAVYAGMSERKARGVLKDLSKKELIHIEHRQNNTSIYTILKIPAQYAGGAPPAGGHAPDAGGVVHDMQDTPAPGADELKKLELKKLELKKLNKKKSRKQVYDDESVYLKLSKHLYEKILENNPNHKKPDFQKWADDVRLMMERDNRTEKEIAFLIGWVQGHHFWSGNILSTGKLREKFDQLVIRYKQERDAPKTNLGRGQGSLREEKKPHWFGKEEKPNEFADADPEFLAKKAKLEAELKARKTEKLKKEEQL